MKQLTGLDASFLYMETPTTFGHVNGLAFYTRPTPEYDPYSEVYRRFDAMVGQLEPLRRRLVTVPFGLDHPYWIDDPAFDLDYHVRHIGLAPPGAADQLADQVSRIVGRAMDRSRPLWEVYVIEGLADGRWAMLTKFHHATVDGAAGVMMLNLITDPTPAGRPDLEPTPWEGEQPPSMQDLLGRTARSLVTNPLGGIRTQLRLAQQVAEAAGLSSVGDVASRVRNKIPLIGKDSGEATEGEAKVKLPLTQAPPTPWNRSITSHRRFAMRGTSLENIKALRVATGATVNDIVMAVCAGALRTYLLRHDALPKDPLRAMVPVSIRTGNETDPWTNRVSAIVADLPTNLADPLERLARCREAMGEAKGQLDLIPADALVQGAQTALPVVATAAMRLATRLRIADRVNLPFNLVISNVPGPREPLYFAGAKLENYIPVSIVTEGMGLNITVHSYVDRIDFGLVASRELMPDLWDLVDLHIDEIGVLFDALGLDWAVPQAPAFLRRGNKYVEGTKKSGDSAPVKKGSAKRASVKKASVKKASVKKASVKKASAKKVSAKKTPAKKSKGK
jgi:diacylglycerol O-acyltransferase / wax synthase